MEETKQRLSTARLAEFGGRATPSSTEDTHADGHNRPLDGGHALQHRLEYIHTRTQFIQPHIYSSYHDCCVKPATHRHVVVSASGPAFQRLLLPRISRGQVPARLGYCCHNCSLLPPRIKLPNTTELLSLPINIEYEAQQISLSRKKNKLLSSWLQTMLIKNLAMLYLYVTL
jgi:hypothetical protein